MRYSQMDHKKMWVEKLERDLSELESLGYSKESEVYKSAVKRTDKARKDLNNSLNLVTDGKK
ncbi:MULTISPECIES: hypothetical protein [unclassified Enterococcus]|uniref:hypothetical protein n=1 Tax=unclassified Enterococcus TaxID=2608891 RepID=UPI000A331E89|nr:hypothetical protein A5852_003524 [Enterococcus faecium]